MPPKKELATIANTYSSSVVEFQQMTSLDALGDSNPTVEGLQDLVVVIGELVKRGNTLKSAIKRRLVAEQKLQGIEPEKKEPVPTEELLEKAVERVKSLKVKLKVEKELEKPTKKAPRRVVKKVSKKVGESESEDGSDESEIDIEDDLE